MSNFAFEMMPSCGAACMVGGKLSGVMLIFLSILYLSIRSPLIPSFTCVINEEYVISSSNIFVMHDKNIEYIQ